MTDMVVEVGPAAVRGPNSAEPEWVSAAIEGIDDDLALVGERPVPGADIWRQVMQQATGGRAATLTVVCPTWWTSSCVTRVRDAASLVADDVIVLRRADVPRDGPSTLVEIALEFVVIASPAGSVEVVSRADVDAVVTRIPLSTPVLLDGPTEVEGACRLAAVIADRLRADGGAVRIADADWVRRSASALPPQHDSEDAEPRPSSNRAFRAVLAGTVVAAAALCGGFVTRHDAQSGPAVAPTTLLVEGRVGVMVPAHWMVQRVTSGPGSARLQIVSPDDAEMAVHVTQSSLAPPQSPEQVAESLRAALSQEPDGVFVEFDPSDRRADRHVVTYREIRGDHHIAWFVLIDGSLRIAIGCQSAPGHQEEVRDVCDAAVRSAHAVF